MVVSGVGATVVVVSGVTIVVVVEDKNSASLAWHSSRSLALLLFDTASAITVITNANKATLRKVTSLLFITRSVDGNRVGLNERDRGEKEKQNQVITLQQRRRKMVKILCPRGLSSAWSHCVFNCSNLPPRLRMISLQPMMKVFLMGFFLFGGNKIGFFLVDTTSLPGTDC